MIRFIIDIFRFPFQGHAPHNKFGQFLKFFLKEFPAYFRTKPKLRKVLIFPFLVLYMIFRRTKYERFTSWIQLLFVVLIGMIGMGGYILFTDFSLTTYIQKQCGHDRHYDRCVRIEEKFGRDIFDQVEAIKQQNINYQQQRLEEIKQALEQKQQENEKTQEETEE